MKASQSSNINPSHVLEVLYRYHDVTLSDTSHIPSTFLAVPTPTTVGILALPTGLTALRGVLGALRRPRPVG